jgi:hypothetical protein
MTPDQEKSGFLEDLEQIGSPAAEVISDYANQPYSPVTDPLQQIETYASAATETALGNASETYSDSSGVRQRCA